MARKNPRRNISRIVTHSSSRKNSGCGWLVRFQRCGEKTSRFFADSTYGGNRNALAAAKEFRDETEANSRKFTISEMASTPSKRNSSGVVGVRLHREIKTYNGYEVQYWSWVAQWIDGHGHRKTRSFSVHQYGDEEAFQKACAVRAKGVAQAKRRL